MTKWGVWFQIPQVLDKMVTRLGDKLNQRLGKRDDKTEDENMLIQVSLNMDKHPPAQMPPVPLGLNQLQVKDSLQFFFVCNAAWLFI